MKGLETNYAVQEELTKGAYEGAELDSMKLVHLEGTMIQEQR